MKESLYKPAAATYVIRALGYNASVQNEGVAVIVFTLRGVVTVLM
jgi:hypothetical protein